MSEISERGLPGSNFTKGSADPDRTVLIVEDSHAILSLLAGLCERIGWQVATASTYESGKAQLIGSSPAICVTDIFLDQGRRGTTLMEEVRALGVESLFVVISGTEDRGEIIQAIRRGAFDYLEKPIQPDLLTTCLDRAWAVVSSRRREQEFVQGLKALANQLQGKVQEKTQRFVQISRQMDEILSALDCGIIRMDSFWNISFVNPAAGRILDIEPDCLLLRPLPVVPELRAIYELLKDLIDSGRPCSPIVYALERGSQGTRWIEARVGFLKPKAGLFSGVLIQLADATQRRLHEEEKLVSNRMMVLGVMGSGIAHEINNPLSVILANLSLLKPLVGGDAGAQQALADIHGAVGRCRAIIETMLGFARRPGEERALIQVADVIQAALALCAPMLRQAKMRFEAIVEPRDLAARINHSDLEQVLVNLIQNAVDAMGESGGCLGIEAHAEGDWVTMCVRDTGPGIPAAIQARIFTPLFTTKPAGRGTGLGLAICRLLVSQNRGQIWCESPPGEGARFHIRLPMARQDGTPVVQGNIPFVSVSGATIVCHASPGRLPPALAHCVEAFGLTIEANPKTTELIIRSVAGDIDLLILTADAPDSDRLLRQIEEVAPWQALLILGVTEGEQDRPGRVCLPHNFTPGEFRTALQRLEDAVPD